MAATNFGIGEPASANFWRCVASQAKIVRVGLDSIWYDMMCGLLSALLRDRLLSASL